MNSIVSNLRSPRSGAPVANQFVLTEPTYTAFKSYSTLIAKYQNGILYLVDGAMDYSRTTSKYLYQFTGMNRAELLVGLKDGSIKVWERK